MNRFSKNRCKAVFSKLYREMYLIGNGLNIFSKGWNLLQFKNKIINILKK